jgi:hypothetical protein
MKETDQKSQRERDVDRTVKLKWKDIPEIELHAALARVTVGFDPAESMKLIEYFYRRIHDNLPYDQTVLFAYLDHAFGKIVSGEQPDIAFGFRQPDATK